jgi:hypothetical protein
MMRYEAKWRGNEERVRPKDEVMRLSVMNIERVG